MFDGETTDSYISIQRTVGALMSRVQSRRSCRKQNARYEYPKWFIDHNFDGGIVERVLSRSRRNATCFKRRKRNPTFNQHLRLTQLSVQL